MIKVDKTYTDNPFVDNLIYYTKTIALNCTIKDQEEALKYETKDSLMAGDLYIACVEGTAKYEMFNNIDKEILSKYIPEESNLDLFAKDVESLKLHLNSLSLYERNQKINNLTKMAQSVYMDHYDVITNYLDNVGESWATENKPLYDKCVDESATYKDLFEIIPNYTVKRIVKQYLNNFDYSNIDSITESLSSFENYVKNRTDNEIKNDLKEISKAMRCVFKDHYDIMIGRGYLSSEYNNYFGDYMYFVDIYNKCLDNTADYKSLYYLFPSEVLLKLLNESIGADTVYHYRLNEDLEILEQYFLHSVNAVVEINNLNKAMIKNYIDNYNIYINFDVYNKCKDGLMDYFDLVDYLPFETLKTIINIEIPEIKNINVYSKNKNMLNSYLNTLDRSEAKTIKDNITVDMVKYYLNNFVETNNYYRTFLGLPELDSNGEPYLDTLTKTYDIANGCYINFGDKYTSMLKDATTYPDIHWESPISEFDSYDIGILNEYGILEEYIQECIRLTNNEKRYKYMNYLGDSKLDIYTCRKAMNFELIGVPTIDNVDAKNMFVDAYVVNRDYILRTVYSDAYKFQSDYYNKFIIIFILLNTIMDVLSKVPDMIINKKVFDSRCVRYLFEANGIPYYSEIPLKYQQAMLKNLNILIKYKSSTKNMVDICNLFGFSDIRVFGYYMLKTRNVDPNTGEYIFNETSDVNYDLNKLYVKDPNGENIDYNGVRYTKLTQYKYYDPEKYLKIIHVKNDDGIIEPRQIIDNKKDLYVRDSNNKDVFISLLDTDYFTTIKADVSPSELKFIKVPVDESLTEYKNNNDYIINYDELVQQDEGNTWDGGLEHEYLKEKILDYEFNAVKTKYISVETVTHMTELSFQVSYFYNMLFDNLYNEDSLTVDIPYIKINHKFRFMDTVCYLFALMYLYNGLEDTIMYSPTQMLYIKGYNFSKDLNTVINDITSFTPNSKTEYDEAENVYRYDESIKNIFDINERIKQDNYDYNKAFENYNIKAFNLQADIDAIDKWLSDNYQMNLEDFVVDDSLTTFDHVITLKQFFTLNNSYYQKSIFKDNLLPSPYNQDIKYAFHCDLYNKEYFKDESNIEHEYIIESVNGNKSYLEIINNKQDSIFILDYVYYAKFEDSNNHALYRKYIKNNEDNYILDSIDYYIFKDNKYVKLLEDGIYIKNNKNKYVFSAKKYYKKNEKPEIYNAYDAKTGEQIGVFVLDDTGVNKYPVGYNGVDKDDSIDVTKDYIEIKDSNYFYEDSNGKTILKLANDYYEYNKETKTYELKEDNCYVKVVKNNKVEYVLVKDLNNYENPKVSLDDCFVRHSDGHFISMIETDLYKKLENGDYEYIDDEELFVKSSTKTEYYDETASPRVYYIKLNDYYKQNNYTMYADILYVKIGDGTFIKESELISPNNCYYMNENGEYRLVIEDLINYYRIDHLKNIFGTYNTETGKEIKFILKDENNNRTYPEDYKIIGLDNTIVLPETKYALILQESNDYNLYKLDNGNYIKLSTSPKRYVRDSDITKIIVLNTNHTYSTTKSLIIVLNKDITSYTAETQLKPDLYNPEEIDKIWDENDWFYADPGYGNDSNIGMNGENKWYYKKPGSDNNIQEDDNKDEDVGSGFYLEASTYLGDTKLEKGTKYYMAFDIETNFNGKIQICNDADVDCTTSSDKVYKVLHGDKQHIAQVFVANDISRPRIKFFIYNFKDYPIENGDYIIISNIRFVKAYSDNNIPQDIPSYDKLQELYKTNEAIYKYLIALMQNCSDYDTYVIYKKLYDSLMLSKYNKEAFKLPNNSYSKTYTDFLRNRDSVLYERLMYFKSLDIDAMHKEVADNIVQVTYAIDDCVDTYSYGYLYSYFPAVSANYIQQYISKIINFFKSWKTHLLGINTVYKFDDGFENTIKILEDADYGVKLNNQKSTVQITDCAKINPIDASNSQGVPYSDLYKDNDFTIYSHNYGDRVLIKDRARLISKTANKIKFTDNYENIHILLNDDDVKMDVKNMNELQATVNNPDIGFKVVKPNELVLISNEDDESIFAGQILEQINLNTTDILDWSDDNE